ncbi:hypothetical protein, partial [Yersinia pestis]
RTLYSSAYPHRSRSSHRGLSAVWLNMCVFYLLLFAVWLKRQKIPAFFTETTTNCFLKEILLIFVLITKKRTFPHRIKYKNQSNVKNKNFMLVILTNSVM